MSYGRYFEELRPGGRFRKIIVPAAPAGETECKR